MIQDRVLSPGLPRGFKGTYEVDTPGASFWVQFNGVPEKVRFLGRDRQSPRVVALVLGWQCIMDPVQMTSGD